LIALIQRVSQAHVVISGQTVGRIGAGLLVLVCAERGDFEAQADRLLAKILKLRIFSDDAGKMNRSVQDIDGQRSAGGLLLVSQFTLAADTSSAATGPVSATRRRPTRGAACTTILWPGRAPRTPWCRPGSLAPTCRCTWSTTGP